MTVAPGSPVVWIGVHDLDRTGVPVVLLRLLRALHPEQRALVHVIAVRGGALESELSPWCATLTALEPTGRRSVTGAAAVALETLGAGVAGGLVRHRAWASRVRTLPRPDVVVVHGAGGWPVLGAAPRSTPYLVHLHELSTGLDRSIPVAHRSELLGGAHRVMTVSRPVADLAVAGGASASRLEVVPGVVDPPPSDQVGVPGPDGGTRWVMGAGTPGWRKGTDRLAALAHPFGRSRPDVRVGWVGGRPSGADATAVAAVDPVCWFDETPDPWALLTRSQVVVVPSREDPLPLAALEAGVRARPVVAMPSGGLTDLLGQGRGMVGDRHDVGWFVGAVERLLDHPELGEELGSALRDRVLAEHLSGPVATRWWELVVDAADR